eukprot:scaffold29240_cov55-Phaeocystis_antarctica.AAC.3
MAETHQPAMGPYFAIAAVGLASKAWTAVFREALVVKVFVKAQAGGESDGDGGAGDGGGGLRLGGGGDGDGGGGLGLGG